MEFIDMEAIKDSEENQPLAFSDNNEEMTNDEMKYFIDDSKQSSEGVSFYRDFDPDNLHHYHKFPNQTRDPRAAIFDNDEMYLGEEDQQPENRDSENT